MERDPYVRLQGREIYRNPWLGVQVHEILHPNGVPGEHVLVAIPRAVAVVVVDDDGDLLFTRQPRFAARKYVIEVVKGGSDDGESPLAAAQRELAEELAVSAREWAPLGRLYEIPSIVDEALDVFVARGLRAAAADPEAHESIEPVRMPFARALQAAAGGEIDDAVTIAALLRYGLASGALRADG